MDNSLHTGETEMSPDGFLMTKAREAVGMFTDWDKLQDAVRELEGTAFPRDSISVMGNHKEIREKFGTGEIDPVAAEDNPDIPREPPVRPEEKTIGRSALVGVATYIGAMSAALAAAPLTVPGSLLAVALGGSSGLAIGTVLSRLLGRHYDRNIEKQIEKGGLLLWVRTPDQEAEYLACEILLRHDATHVNVHDIVP